jgi:predicted HTH domain antitoxin
MTLTIELPNDLAEHEDPVREALEAFAVEAYRTEVLTHHEAASMLSLGRIAFDDVLKRKGVTNNFYNVDDLLEDIATSDRLRAAGKLP